MSIKKKKRKLNAVDKLKARIKEIQKSCKHDWKLIKKPELSESLVPGIFIGNKASPLETTFQKEISLKCNKCSRRLIAPITSICPCCFGSMYKGGLYTIENDGMSSREKYFGEPLAYHAVRLHHCSKCGFTIASDEWNQ